MNLFLNISLIISLAFFASYRAKTFQLIGLGFVAYIVMLVVFRSDAVPDTDNYIEFFTIQSSDFLHFDLYPEYGFQLLMKICKLFSDDYSMFFLMVALFNTLHLALILRCHPKLTNESGDRNFLLFFVLYFAFFGYYYNAIVLRSGIAMMFVVSATLYACLEDKTKKDLALMILCQVLALLFHVSSAIGIPILVYLAYQNNERKYTRNLLILILSAFVYFTNIGSFVALGLVDSVLSRVALFNEGLSFSRFEIYLDGSESSGVAFKYIFFLLSAFLLNRMNIDNMYYRKILHIYIIGIFIFSFFRSVLIIERITDFFTIFSFVLYYILISNLKCSSPKSHLNKLILIIGICVAQLIFAFRIINT